MKKNEECLSLFIKLGLVLVMSVLLSACASGPLKAPCNQYATFCGTKTPINQWR